MASEGLIRSGERAANQFESIPFCGITGSFRMTSQQLELIARRGLTLPEPTLTRLRTVGIWCEANLTLQRRDQDWIIRGRNQEGRSTTLDATSASVRKTAVPSAGCTR